MPSVKDRLGAINDQVNSDKYRPPVFVILGTAKVLIPNSDFVFFFLTTSVQCTHESTALDITQPITTLTADQAFDVLKIDNDICPHHLCILLPPLRRGDRASREQGQRLIEELYEKVKPDDSSGLWRPRRPIRAIYIHDVQLEGEQAVIDEDDRRQHAQLDFAVELIGTIRGKPARLVRYGPERSPRRKENIRKRWKEAFEAFKAIFTTPAPLPEKDVQTRRGLYLDAMADLVGAGNEMKLLRFEKQLDCKGLVKTDLYRMFS